MVKLRGGKLRIFEMAALGAALFVLVPGMAWAAEDGVGHTDPVTPLLLALTIFLVGAKLAGDLMVRIGQPAVLGELLFGVLLGNLSAIGWIPAEGLRPPAHPGDTVGLTAQTLDMLGRIGVLLLLFEVGLDSNIGAMRRVGRSALLVAVLGVIAPMILGYGVSAWLMPEEAWPVHLFVGATLCATSVGITARVLKDLNRATSIEAQIVLGAAVIDDVLGLIILAVVQGIIVSGGADFTALAVIVLKAFGFLAGALLIGRSLSPRLFRIAAKLRVHGMLGVTAMSFCFLFSWAASEMGLAPIVGAFAAGLLLEEDHYRVLLGEGERNLEEWVLPIATLLVPIFFVLMGFQVNLRALADPSVVTFAGAILVAALIGKQICALGVIDQKVDRLSIGIGMIPRGEVGLIFAAIGAGLHYHGHPVISPPTYTAVVIMVMVTTMITPPLLSWSLRRGGTVRTPKAE